MHAARVRIGSFIVAFSLLGIGCAVDGKAGAPGAPGSLVTVSAEPPGANCAGGGERISVGRDTNGNGVLDPAEVTGTSYVCNGESAWPVGSGIMQNLSLSALTTAGWRVCYEDTYADGGASISTILANCPGAYLMLACKQVASQDTIALAAADNRGVVAPATQDAAAATAFHTSNGVGWYFTDTYSWGFFPATDTVNRSSCDFDNGTQTNKDKRLCWHAGSGSLSTGYRCGNNQLNFDTTWNRIVLAF